MPVLGCFGGSFVSPKSLKFFLELYAAFLSFFNFFSVPFFIDFAKSFISEE